VVAPEGRFLPRRTVRHAEGRDQPLRLFLQPRADRPGERRPNPAPVELMSEAPLDRKPSLKQTESAPRSPYLEEEIHVENLPCPTGNTRFLSGGSLDRVMQEEPDHPRELRGRTEREPGRRRRPVRTRL